MVNLSDHVPEALAGEAVSCRNCLESKNPIIPPNGERYFFAYDLPKSIQHITRESQSTYCYPWFPPLIVWQCHHDSVHMQDNVPGDEQPLFARMALNSVTNVDQTLNERRVAKFLINDKHIWARKYEGRE
ncbi:hypothetical protein V6N12_056759 [Hibiscus sabdariffa]|uniref:Uncharacterized protein n=1 Tax=Hibiscus sabdariffa TaxID=183260 RepID=A0ABR2DC02_9ROSI